MFARSDEYFARVKFRTKSRTELASTVTSSPKVLTSPLLTGTRPRQESFLRTTGIGIYLRRTLYIRIIYFPPVITQHRQRGRELVSLPFISPHYFDPRHPSAPCRRIVTYSASRGSCTELRVGPISRKNIRRTLIITRSTKFLCSSTLHLILRHKYRVSHRNNVSQHLRTDHFFDQFGVYFSWTKIKPSIIYSIVNNEKEKSPCVEIILKLQIKTGILFFI